MSIGPEYKKKYGLIIPKSKEAAPVKKRPLSSVFNIDSDEEDEAPKKQAPSTAFKNMKRQAKIDIQRALEDDPSVYQYDEIYDTMKEDKQKKVAVAKQDKTSKYAKNLIRNAAVRKLENDRHFERQCQRELEDEGDEFADKESFITSSYKNKLAELAVLEEEHKRMAEEEKKNDVTKKRDLTDFYRDILSQRTAEVASSVASSVSQAKPAAPPAKEMEESPAPSEPQPASPTQTEPKSPEEKTVIKKIRTEKQRTYRSRRVTSDQVRSRDTASEGGSDSETESEVVKPSTSSANTTEKTSPEKAKGSEDEKNLDKDDSDSSDSEEDEKEEENKEGEEEEGEEEAGPAEVKKLLMTEAEQREERVRLVKESCKKRNTPDTIKSAIERYWKRQAAVAT
ncbi:nuclear speckle splicing regulatory protein 1-like isoform X1 [Bolinopsis microptera]|uniref:nuclear speckle splicing regulatory protein 1-like isoform X1 n=1 Tax=Bolinopsis microptera TaxID=2820187 RepID=UPI003079CD56